MTPEHIEKRVRLALQFIENIKQLKIEEMIKNSYVATITSAGNTALKLARQEKESK